jgi:adenylate cyclase
MSNRSRKNFKTLAIIVAIACLSAGIFNLLTAEMSAGAFLQGAIDAFFVSALLGSYIVFGVNWIFRSAFENRSFVSTVTINSLAFLVFFLGGRFIGLFLTHPDIRSFGSVYFSENFFQSVWFALGLSVAINFVVQMNRLVGQNVLVYFLTGTYHKPKQEERFFMFLDLESSTEIAERLGNLNYHRLLNRFFFDLTDAVLEVDGEIYEYAGDEVLISWKKRKGLDVNNCLRCFFLAEEAINKRSALYETHFGITPRFRAALHGGSVIAGELGDVKQKIAFVGDVLNTTARMMEFCRTKKRRFVVSGQVIDQLGRQDGLDLEDLGEFQPRGKEQSLRVYSVGRR